ncbi:hypothetical protein QBC36DRAFT_308478 [Triangularia setosa]|uniref:Uncharacterized protein n=1 Tax=Triangularia setosa TaxID=2587417 RepID=A0AAN6WEN9_9PEZI|nr:hypothetical protein QBC36DRAFT_308478 [Podospora setosa]
MQTFCCPAAARHPICLLAWLAPLPPTQGAALTQLALVSLCSPQLHLIGVNVSSELLLYSSSYLRPVSGLTVPDNASSVTVSSVPTVIHLTTASYAQRENGEPFPDIAAPLSYTLRGCGFRFPEYTTMTRSDSQIPDLLVTYLKVTRIKP